MLHQCSPRAEWRQATRQAPDVRCVFVIALRHECCLRAPRLYNRPRVGPTSPGSRDINRRTIIAGAVSLTALIIADPSWADMKYDGVTLNIASQNDQFAPVLAALAPKFKEATGATVKVDILDYPIWPPRSRLIRRPHQGLRHRDDGHRLVGPIRDSRLHGRSHRMDQARRAEIKVDDIYPSLMSALGGYNGKQVAFPFAGYANVLAYRKDLYAAAGLKPPSTMEELVEDAIKLTDRRRNSMASSPTVPRVRPWPRTGCSITPRSADRT